MLPPTRICDFDWIVNTQTIDNSDEDAEIVAQIFIEAGFYERDDFSFGIEDENFVKWELETKIDKIAEKHGYKISWGQPEYYPELVYN